jgi:hypothetical protein
MPIFVCDNCGAMENTALGAYWCREGRPRLCSECCTGTWHGKFPKVQWDGKREVVNRKPAEPSGEREGV